MGMSCPWEEIDDRRETPPSWALALRLRGQGIAAIIVPSFASGATPEDVNIVFWHWGSDLPHRLTVIDDEHRLPRDQSSWEAPGGDSTS
jgi:RES domain-containing protein